MSHRPILLAPGIAALLFLGVLAWMLFPSTPARTKTLADGSIITLRKVSTGTNFVYDTRNLLQRTTGKFMSPKWQARLGLRPGIGPIPLPSESGTGVVHWFWLSMKGPIIHNLPGGIRPSSTLALKDDSGGEIHTQCQSLLPGASELSYLFQVPMLPTGSRRLSAELLPPHPISTLFSQPIPPPPIPAFDIANPDYIAAPKWQPTLLPLTNGEDGFQLAITAFEVDAEPVFRRQRGIFERGTTLDGTVSRLSATGPGWKVSSARLFNEAGREAREAPNLTEARPGRFSLRCNDALATNSLWKLRFYLEADPPDLRGDAIWLEVPNPAVTGKLPGVITTNVGNVVVKFYAEGLYDSFTIITSPPELLRRLRCTRILPKEGEWVSRLHTAAVRSGYYAGQWRVLPGGATILFKLEWEHLRTVEVILRPTTAQPAGNPAPQR